MISLSPYVMQELGADGTVVGTHIKVRVVNGTRARFVGDFEIVAEALSKCRPENVLDFLRTNKGPCEDVEKQGAMLCGVYYSPAQFSHEEAG